MQKYFIVLSLLLSCLFTHAQDLPVDVKSGKITFIKTVDATGLTAQNLYDISKTWGTENGFSIKEDVSGKKIVFNASCKVEYPATKSAEKVEGTVHYEFHIGAKEGKYRYIATKFEHKGPHDGGALEDRVPDCEFTNLSSRSWIVVKKQTHKELITVIEGLKKKIKAEQNDPTKNDDW